MNRARMWLLGSVALALGAFVSITMYRNLQSKGAIDAPGIDVVIAAADLQVGSKIGDGDVKLVHFPTGDLPPKCFHRKSSVVGRGVVLPIAKGEFVLPNKLAGENAGTSPISPRKSPINPPLVDPPLIDPRGVPLVDPPGSHPTEEDGFNRRDNGKR